MHVTVGPIIRVEWSSLFCQQGSDMYKIIVVVIVLLNASGCSSLGISLSPPQNNLSEQAESVLNRSTSQAVLSRELDMNVLITHFLQPGDVLIVEPVKFDSEIIFPADQKVMADGTIDLGKFGRVIVAGMTLEQAENHVENTIVNVGEDAIQINVRLIEAVHRIYVLGEVASPGAYPFAGNETVLDGILAAGGLTTQANQCKVLLARPTTPASCRVALPICYREITQLGDTTTNYQLQPGDRIYVASRSFRDSLQFWKANKTCDRCCKCQFPCPDPGIASFNNVISLNLPAAPLLPKILPDSRTKELPLSRFPLDPREQTLPATRLPSPTDENPLDQLPKNIMDAPPSTRDGQLQFEPDAFLPSK